MDVWSVFHPLPTEKPVIDGDRSGPAAPRRARMALWLVLLAAAGTFH